MDPRVSVRKGTDTHPAETAIALPLELSSGSPPFAYPPTTS